MKFWGLVLSLIAIGGLFSAPVGAESGASDFQRWLADFRVEARAAGISEKTLTAAFAEVQGPLPRVIEFDRNQPELTQSLADYVATRVSATRIAAGQRMSRRYPTWLGRIEQRYGVQPRFLLALWGIETNYGEHSGSFPVIPALATLAHDGRRSGYFRKELLAALRILDAGHISLAQMKGSWAGAMGQCQFMPSSFRNYAVDADANGRIDIWSSVPDVLASAANYLQKSGWQNDQTWGRQVLLPAVFDYSLAGLQTRLPLSRWQELGLRRFDGSRLPRRELAASLILADGPEGPAYLVYDNFRALLAWNNSSAFAVAVGTLADKIAGKQ
jgi:membrane-bound lytic murein transglycosylase B